MDQTTTITKFLRTLQFRKHVKELTSACKRINKDACYEFVTYRHGTATKKSNKFHFLRSKISNYKEKSKSACRLSTRIRPKQECSPSPPAVMIEKPAQVFEHLAYATSTSPANFSMIVKQSYKPLHVKSSQLNKNTIAVTKDTLVNALYAVSNWVFIEIIETGQCGFVPIYCLRLSDMVSSNNLSLLNVSIYEKSPSILHTSTPPTAGRFISSIGPCHPNSEQAYFTCPRVKKAGTYARQNKDQSNLSRQISNISLHAYDHDAYGTLNLTPCKNLSFSILDSEPMTTYSNNRLRVLENYQRQFIGDISVLESEVVTLVNTVPSEDDWRLVRRGDGRQGYIPKHIVVHDKKF